MPLYYRGILEEHAAVRERAGLFDVSHMGILTVTGEHGAALLARRTTCDVPRLAPGRCRYAFWLDSEGRILDDLLIARTDDAVHGSGAYLVVPNAGRADRIFDLLLQHRRPDTTVARHNGALAILALQGPRARELLERVTGWSVAALRFYSGRCFAAPPAPGDAGRLGAPVPDPTGAYWWASRTGYTGELGYELFVPAARAIPLAEELLAAGAVPCGLGARDTLRLEAGYLLSWSEFLLDRTPLEASQERFVDFDHAFVGRTALLAQRERGPAERLVGLEVRAAGAIPRHGTPILEGERPVGHVTSGGLAPTLGYGIALAYVPSELARPGAELAVEIRQRRVPARVVALPFRPSPPARP
jgi:glycine cleavage system T protein (aminomethyltransferase)